MELSARIAVLALGTLPCPALAQDTIYVDWVLGLNPASVPSSTARRRRMEPARSS